MRGKHDAAGGSVILGLLRRWYAMKHLVSCSHWRCGRSRDREDRRAQQSGNEGVLIRLGRQSEDLLAIEPVVTTESHSDRRATYGSKPGAWAAADELGATRPNARARPKIERDFKNPLLRRREKRSNHSGRSVNFQLFLSYNPRGDQEERRD